MNVPLGKPFIEEYEINIVKDILASGWLIDGPKNKEFEEKFANYIGVKYATSCNSCASALHLALASAGIKPKDEVIIPSFTHSATANAVVTNGAVPVFTDIEMETYGMSPEDLIKKITNKTKAVIPVHFAGLPCNINEIKKICDEHNLILIEDNAESLGSEVNGKKTGSLGIGCFSFYPTKNITSGEGGMLTSNNEEIYRIASEIKNHGNSKSTFEREGAKYPWRRVQNVVGFNFRLTNFQAALGVSQLEKLDRMNEMRREKARLYNKLLSGINELTLPTEPKGRKHVYQMYTPRINKKINRDEFLLKLKEKGVGITVPFGTAVHKQPYYVKNFDSNKYVLPNTDEIMETMFVLPMYPQITAEEINYVANSVKEVIKDLK